MKFAWVENDKIRDICLGGSPADCYHPDVAVFYDTEVPDEAENGDGWVNGKLVKKPEPAPAPEQPRQWNQNDFRTHMTLSEKVVWDNDSAPEVKTVKSELPKDEAGTQELVDFLVSSNVISQATADKIMA